MDQYSMKDLHNVQHLSLYHYDSCPFCMMTKMELAKTKLGIEQRNIQQNSTYLNELISGGGKRQVPCLRIQRENGNVEWLYESRDIVRWVNAYKNSVKTAA